MTIITVDAITMVVIVVEIRVNRSSMSIALLANALTLPTKQVAAQGCAVIKNTWATVTVTMTTTTVAANTMEEIVAEIAERSSSTNIATLMPVGASALTL